MKIILRDINCRGYHFEELDFEIPNVQNLEDVTREMLTEYVVADLDWYIDFHESFMVEET